MSFMTFSTVRETFLGLNAIITQEVRRCTRIWIQAIVLSALSPLLYLLVFGCILGPHLSFQQGTDYPTFLFSGLLVSTAVTTASSNVGASYFSAKYFGSIEAILTAPIPSWAILLGYMIGGLVRTALVCGVFALFSAFLIPIQCASWFHLCLVLLVVSMTFSLVGLLSALLASSYDEIGLLTTLLLTPLSYFSGSLYPLDFLSPFWKRLTYWNPLSHLVSAARAACLGNPLGTLPFYSSIAVCLIGLFLLNLWLIRKEKYGCLE